MTTLTFQKTTLSVINQQNQIWFSISDIASALGYKETNGVTRLYNAHQDEFTPCMTTLVDTQTNGGIQKVRIFSLRGTHLIGMLSQTKVAKEFRKWVLDILDREISQKTEQNLPLAEPNKHTPLVIIRKDSKELKLFLRLLSHAHEYSKIQEAIRNGTSDPRLLPICQHLLYQHDNGEGFMFSFKANVQSDLAQASDLIAHIV